VLLRGVVHRSCCHRFLPCRADLAPEGVRVERDAPVADAQRAPDQRAVTPQRGV